MAPPNVGIKGIEIYIPNTCLDQQDLEKHDGVGAGKYTVGLGQKKMAFCNDREDIYSMALSAVSSLVKKFNVDLNQIGRLEVGTETLLDKSKSVKTVLMQLFAESGNHNVEGVDTINACYGGTNAVLNALNWVESSGWDGRDAIVVAGDIAIYNTVPARPSGGAGVVAMLIGPNAPLSLQTKVRGSYMQHEYDFFKPDFTSEYPVVDGKYSLECYTRAIDQCYTAYKQREAAVATQSAKGCIIRAAMLDSNGGGVTTPEDSDDESSEQALVTDRFDYMCFHSPISKLVAKSYARLLYNDYVQSPSHPKFDSVDPELSGLSFEQSITDRRIEKAFMTLSKDDFEQRVQPAMLLPNYCGNMYTASVYSSLCSLLTTRTPNELLGKRIGLFSYGSGLASTLFSIKVTGDVSQMHTQLNLQDRLDKRVVLSPKDYEAALQLREHIHMKKGTSPVGSTEHMVTGAYYLDNISEGWRRKYGVIA